MRRTTKSPTVSAIDVASLEVAGCRPLDHRSGAREARAVAGTVPRPLGRVPLHVATHVRADRRERVELPAFVPVGSGLPAVQPYEPPFAGCEDRKSTRLNSSHANISYAVFCLKKKTRFLYEY